MSENQDVRQQLAAQRERLLEAFFLEKVKIFTALKERFGEEVLDVVQKVETEQACRFWNRQAQRHGSNTIKDLIELLCNHDGFEYTMEEKDNGVQLCFTKCKHHEFAKQHGIEEWVYQLMCAKDPFIAESFNPKIGFKRTKTLMEGHDCCDHYYYIKE